MPSLAHRMRKLQTKLLAIRLGSGALILPKDVKRIHMRFAKKLYGGHLGPRKFWHHELVRLKYHNPAVPMTVDTSALASEPPVMSIHFASSDAPQTSDSATSSPAPVNSTSSGTHPGQHSPTERVETIEMRNIDSSEILQHLIRITKAHPIEPTPQEQQELQALEEQRATSLQDRERSLAVRARQKREKDLLEQARGDFAAQEA